ncbi:serine hydrolase [Amycolatopsis sp. SID8362]|uniref:serine hydrolase n=1 Tax=Amycolatopsis sp. SID8362 TaxID=2690346 RepID=UPI00136C60BC|nr:serine hydrolase [Amycolatopsis sp. SID8362]NED48843.1 beta-lactamase family protein [Amycolatopsis sp. SID8362]
MNQRPQFKPGYHALTFGRLTGEILRRATGLRPRDLIADHLSRPLDVQAWIGIPHRKSPAPRRTRSSRRS